MPVKKQNKTSNIPTTEAEVAVLVGILEKITNFSQQLDTQANIIIGLSLAIFVFATSSFQSGNVQPYSFVLAMFAGVSALVGLLVMHPPKFMRRPSKDQSLMFIKHIADSKDAESYARSLKKVISSREETIRQYGLEIYNMSTRYYQPKKKLFNLSKSILLTGIAVSLTIFLFSIRW